MSKKNKELEIKQDIVNIEDLILDGSEVNVPITFDLPTIKGLIKVSAMIRPLTTPEWETATNKSIKNNNQGFTLEILRKGLLNSDGEELDKNIINKMPIGVVNELYLQIADISGVKEDKEEQYRLTKELMGF